VARTTAADVDELLDTTLSDSELSVWIDIATEVVDEVATQAPGADAGRLEKLERLVAAHLAIAQDAGAGAESRSSATRSISYSTEYGEGFRATDHGQAALALESVIGTNVLSGATKPQAGLSVPDVKQSDRYH
jgi:hypothetical protein